MRAKMFRLALTAFLSLFCVFTVLPSSTNQRATAALKYEALSCAVVDKFAASQFDKVYAQLGATIAAAISPNRLAQVWDQILA